MKRTAAIFLSAALLCTSAGVRAETYYQTKEVQTLTNGVTHTYINQYTDAGWQKIHVVEADLTAPYVSAGILTHKNGLGYAANVQTLAKDADSLAAVNSDFFARNAWDKASTIGIAVKDGEVLSDVSSEINGAAIGFDADNNVIMDYVTTTAVFTAANGNSIPIHSVNKYDSLKEPAVYTNAFSPVTGGSYDNVLEVVVIDGVVTEMRRNMDGVELPDNGYVIRHLTEYNTFLWENVQVGDEVTLTVDTSVDISKIKSACGGGTLLVENGQKHQITHNVGGTNPRTFAGCDKSRKKLFLVTVDGRKGDAAGMTMSGMQDLALSLGMDTAINLDGGGSTTMVLKDQKTGSFDVVNTPSDGGLRTVPMGLQIRSDAPKGTAKTLVLKTDDKKMFVGSTRTITIDSALDEYGNVCDIPQGDLVLTSDGGTVSGNVFRAERSGKITVSAAVGGAAGSVEFEVLDAPQILYTKPMSVYKDQSFVLYGRDKNGYEAVLNPSDCTEEDFDKYKIYRFGDAEGAVYFNEGNTDTFEGQNGTASAYPSDTASASYQMTNEASVSGALGGKLSYSFKKGAATQAAYLNFSTAKAVPQAATHFGVWVYAPSESYQWLRAEGTDESGKTVRLTLSDSLEFSGWQYVTAPIPSGMKTLDRLYVVQNDKKVACDSYLVFDNAEFLTENRSLPVYRSVSTAQKAENSSFTLTVTGETAARDTLFSRLYDAELAKKLAAQGADLSAALGAKTDKEIGTEQFRTFEKGENGAVILAANKSGITGADSSQWSKLKTFLSGTHKNVFILLPINPDLLPNRQGEVLKGILSEYVNEKNLFVFMPGAANQTEKKDGITYVSVSGLKFTSGSVLLDQRKYTSFALVTVQDGVPAVTFESAY